MYIRYLSPDIVLCAATSYTDFRIRAKKIITGGLGDGSTYALKISETSFNLIKKIYKRRKDNYSFLFSCLSPEKCLCKKPIDFKHCFTRESIGYKFDDDHLDEAYEKIIIDMDMEPCSEFGNETALDFYLRTFRSFEHNKVRLRLLMQQFIENELIFKNESIKNIKILYKELRVQINDNTYKKELMNFSECIVDGIESGMDFEIITTDPYFTDDRKLKKIMRGIGRIYGNDYNGCIVPLYDAYGHVEKEIPVLVKSVLKK